MRAAPAVLGFSHLLAPAATGTCYEGLFWRHWHFFVELYFGVFHHTSINSDTVAPCVVQFMSLTDVWDFPSVCCQLHFVLYFLCDYQFFIPNTWLFATSFSYSNFLFLYVSVFSTANSLLWLQDSRGIQGGNFPWQLTGIYEK